MKAGSGTRGIQQDRLSSGVAAAHHEVAARTQRQACGRATVERGDRYEDPEAADPRGRRHVPLSRCREEQANRPPSDGLIAAGDRWPLRALLGPCGCPHPRGHPRGASSSVAGGRAQPALEADRFGICNKLRLVDWSRSLEVGSFAQSANDRAEGPLHRPSCPCAPNAPDTPVCHLGTAAATESAKRGRLRMGLHRSI